MTLRDNINRKKRWSAVVAVGSFVLFGVTGAIASQHQGAFALLPFLPFAAFGGTILYQMFGIRCGNCSGPIGRALNGTGKLFSVPSDFRFCPYCGIDLDTDFEGAQQT